MDVELFILQHNENTDPFSINTQFKKHSFHQLGAFLHEVDRSHGRTLAENSLI